MAVCESCGERVQDGLTICPECGRPVKKMQTSLGLKGENGKKPVKTTAFNPADEYGDMVDSNSIGGSEPVTLSKDKLADYKAETKKARRKRGPGVFGWIIRLVILAAIGYGVYYLFMDVILKPDGPETYEACLDLLVENLNSKDSEQMETSIPPFITANKDQAEKFLSHMQDATIDTYEIMPDDTHNWSKTEMTAAEDRIQLEHGKSVSIKEGVTCKVRLKGKAKNVQGNHMARYAEVEMSFIKIRGVWYFDIEEFDTASFTGIKVED